MDLHPDFKDLLAAFSNENVRFLVVGGWAVAVHAEPRFTKDIDLWISSAPENIARAASALERFGAPPITVTRLRELKEDEFMFFGVPPVRVDILLRVDGLDFERAWENRISVEWNVSVSILGFDDLCESKRVAGRKKDLEDLARLQPLRKK